MAVKFQYNKTSLNNLNKQLKMRKNALPTLKNKESALRVSVIAAKAKSEKLLSELEAALAENAREQADIRRRREKVTFEEEIRE